MGTLHSLSTVAFTGAHELSLLSLDACPSDIDFHHVCYQPITNKRKMFLPIFAIVVIHKDTCLMDFILLLLLVETPSDWNKLMSKFRFSCCMSHQIGLWSSSVNDTGRKFLWLKLVKRKKKVILLEILEKRQEESVEWSGKGYTVSFVCIYFWNKAKLCTKTKNRGNKQIFRIKLNL